MGASADTCARLILKLLEPESSVLNMAKEIGSPANVQCRLGVWWLRVSQSEASDHGESSAQLREAST